MTTIKNLRQSLEEKLVVLTAHGAKLESSLRRPGHSDWTEQAQERDGDMVREALGDHDRREIAMIEAALQRMDDGTYGTCVTCEEPIPERRLEALPYTIKCVGCAA